VTGNLNVTNPTTATTQTTSNTTNAETGGPDDAVKASAAASPTAEKKTKPTKTKQERTYSPPWGFIPYRADGTVVPVIGNDDDDDRPEKQTACTDPLKLLEKRRGDGYETEAHNSYGAFYSDPKAVKALREETEQRLKSAKVQGNKSSICNTHKCFPGIRPRRPVFRFREGAVEQKIM